MQKNSQTTRRLIDKTYDQLCRALYRGEILPGDWLRQQSIAEEYAVSQATAREALNRLVEEGLGERIPRKGVHIPVITRADLIDIYEIRSVAEGLAWEAAAKFISKESIQAMKDLLPLTGSTADPDSVAIARQKNMEFHMIAINASRRWTLINLLKSLLSFNNLFYLLSTTDEELRVKNGEKNIAEHKVLVGALEKGDSDLAKKLVTNHIQSAKEDRISLHPGRISH